MHMNQTHFTWSFRQFKASHASWFFIPLYLWRTDTPKPGWNHHLGESCPFRRITTLGTGCCSVRGKIFCVSSCQSCSCAAQQVLLILYIPLKLLNANCGIGIAVSEAYNTVSQAPHVFEAGQLQVCCSNISDHNSHLAWPRKPPKRSIKMPIYISRTWPAVCDFSNLNHILWRRKLVYKKQRHAIIY